MTQYSTTFYHGHHLLCFVQFHSQNDTLKCIGLTITQLFREWHLVLGCVCEKRSAYVEKTLNYGRRLGMAAYCKPLLCSSLRMKSEWLVSIAAV